MANFDTIKAAIDANINTNGNQAITGAVMNSVLKQMVDSTDAELTELESETIRLESDVFNLDKEWSIEKGYAVNSGDTHVLLSYLGKTPCVFKISGTSPQRFRIQAKNKETGNLVDLVNYIYSDAMLPLEFANPRPDLELVDVNLFFPSAASSGSTLAVKITKSNPFEEIQEEVNKIQSKVATDSVIFIKIKASSNVVSQLSDGEYGWNTATNELILKTSDSYIAYTPTLNGLYYYDGVFYRWNGTTLVETISPFAYAETIDTILFEQGSINILGTLVDSDIRIRTSSYIRGERELLLPDGYKFVVAAYYNENTLEFDSAVGLSTSRYKFGKEGCVFKFTIGKIGDKDITPGSLPNSSLAFLADKIVQNVGIETARAVENESTKGVIFIKIKASSNVVLQLSDGEYGWNTATNELILKTSDSYIAYTPTLNGLYYYNGVFYRWNGTTLENVYDGKYIFSAGYNALNSLLIEQGSIVVSAGTLVDNVARVRTSDYIHNNVFIAVPNGYKIYYIVYYNAETLAYDSNVYINATSAVVGKDKCVAKVIFVKDDISADISPSELKYDFSKENFNHRISVLEKSRLPMVKIGIDHVLKDVSEERKLVDYSSNNGSPLNMLEQVYNLYDGLVSSYPNLVSRVDAAELVGLEYPKYAQLGGQQGGDDVTITFADDTTYTYRYEPTPTYKTYMYRFVDSSNAIGNSTNFPKKKLFLIAGVHGNEIAAPFNSYILAKQWCECSDINIDAFHSAYDLYIIPCLNGYGMYHTMRCNANFIDINRNMPIKEWHILGNDRATRLNPYQCVFSGNNAGSEFESQLIMAIFHHLKPELVIDHHNYGYGENQYYTDVAEQFLPLAYQSAVDCSFVFRKGLPEYFGEKHNIVLKTEDTSSPYKPFGRGIGSVALWCTEMEAILAATIEICAGINFLGGEHAPKIQDHYGNDTFSVGEYTLRSQVFRFAQMVLELVA